MKSVLCSRLLKSAEFAGRKNNLAMVLQITSGEVTKGLVDLQGSNGWIVLAVAGLVLSGFLLFFLLKKQNTETVNGFKSIIATLDGISKTLIERDEKSAGERKEIFRGLTESFDHISDATRDHDSKIQILTTTQSEHGNTLRDHGNRIVKIETKLEK